MTFVDIVEKDKENFNSLVTHPLQSFEWGEYRKKTAVKVIRRGLVDSKGKLISGFQITIHKIPQTPWTIGYVPKGLMPTEEIIEELKKIGKENKCIFIQLEPNIEIGDWKLETGNWELIPSAHPLFTKYTFELDLTKSEEELLKNMHSKTRYNIHVAQKHGVEVVEDNSYEAFEIYLQLTHETTTRQKFFAHTPSYHRLMWQELKAKNFNLKSDELSVHRFIATYKNQPLVAWILFVFKDTLYYPYGASSSKYREVMASNLLMWEAIKFGGKLGLKKFDMWGALEQNPDPKDSWIGFHKFKLGYNPRHVEFVGSYDLVINPIAYFGYKIADRLRWLFLRLKK